MTDDQVHIVAKTRKLTLEDALWKSKTHKSYCHLVQMKPADTRRPVLDSRISQIMADKEQDRACCDYGPPDERGTICERKDHNRRTKAIPIGSTRCQS